MGRKRRDERPEKGAASATPKTRPSQADINRQLRAWPPRRIASWSLMIGGLLIAGQHILAHAGVRPLPLTMGWQDLLVGYPMAFVVCFLGALLIDPRPKI